MNNWADLEKEFKEMEYFSKTKMNDSIIVEQYNFENAEIIEFEFKTIKRAQNFIDKATVNMGGFFHYSLKGNTNES